MALLLKIAPDNFDAERVVVALSKSDKCIGDDDVGLEIFVWFTDTPQQKSHVALRGILEKVGHTSAPQKRDSTKTTDALELVISGLNNKIALPLETDDVNAFRYDPPQSAMADIGRLHRDRNEKIIRISDEARAILNCRFEE